jgi:hypothetical protein
MNTAYCRRNAENRGESPHTCEKTWCSDANKLDVSGDDRDQLKNAEFGRRVFNSFFEKAEETGKKRKCNGARARLLRDGHT